MRQVINKAIREEISMRRRRRLLAGLAPVKLLPIGWTDTDEDTLAL